jgi:dUTP pyrophosphatase
MPMASCRTGILSCRVAFYSLKTYKEKTVIKILFERFPHSEGLDLPTYATAGSVGVDLCAALSDTVILNPGERVLIPTGFSIAVPEGYEAQIRSRSGLALKQKLVVLNSPGTIDQDYRGEVQVILMNHSKEPITLTRGMRIAQMVFAPIVKVTFDVVKELPIATTRGEGGFGSTGL